MPIFIFLVTYRKTSVSFLLVNLSYGTIFQPDEVRDWLCPRHSGFNFKVASKISPWLEKG
jgi:hypothetical protein